MKQAADLLTQLGSALAALDDSGRAEAPIDERLRRFLDTLRALVEGAALYAGVLFQGSHSFARAVDAHGDSHADICAVLEAEWRKFKETAETGRELETRIAEALTLPGHEHFVEPLRSANHWHGVLALRWRLPAPIDEKRAARALLRVFAQHVVVNLDDARRKTESTRMAAELKEQTELADMGELSGQLAHKFNNFLNSLLLKIALLETDLSEAQAAKFADTRVQARHMAEVIKQTTQSRRRQPALATAHDLNALLQRLFGERGIVVPIPLQLMLSAQPALVAGSAVDYQRMCTFLLRNIIVGTGSAQRTLVLRTERTADKVLFAIEDSGPSLPSALIPNLFEVDAVGLPEAAKMELATCKSLVRRLQGRIQAAPKGDHGLLISVEFPLAKA